MQMMTGAGGSWVVWIWVVLLGAQQMQPAAAEWLALGLIIFAGIPHGAFDLRAARRVWSGRHLGLVGVFYIGIGLLMSGLCLALPGVGLVLFLAISAAHFAEGESEELGQGVAWFVGGSAILLPIALHIDEAAQYLAFFVAYEELMQWAGALWRLGVGFSLAVCGVIGVQWRRGRPVCALELLFCLAGWLSFSPLAGFAVWFIGRHSRGHLRFCRERLTAGRALITVEFLVVSAAAILLILPLGLRFDLNHIDQLFAASIVVIAGLTLPHMFVTHRVMATLERSDESLSRV